MSKHDKADDDDGVLVKHDRNNCLDSCSVDDLHGTKSIGFSKLFKNKKFHKIYKEIYECGQRMEKLSGILLKHKRCSLIRISLT